MKPETRERLERQENETIVEGYFNRKKDGDYECHYNSDVSMFGLYKNDSLISTVCCYSGEPVENVIKQFEENLSGE